MTIVLIESDITLSERSNELLVPFRKWHVRCVTYRCVQQVLFMIMTPLHHMLQLFLGSISCQRKTSLSSHEERDGKSCSSSSQPQGRINRGYSSSQIHHRQKRNCIGQNMAMLQLRVITAYFIRYFDFELIEEPGKEFFLTLKPTSMMMKVRKAY